MESNRRGLLGLLLVAFLVCLASPQSVYPGPFDSIKKKAEKKASDTAKQAEKAVTGEVPADGAAGAAPGDSGEAASPGGTEVKVSAVSTKFDFVPGDSVIFYDDFTQDELGEFPSRWKLAMGTFEVAELEGERWLRCVSDDGHIRMKVPPTLPEFWTLEFDGNRLDAAGNTLTVTGLSTDGSTMWEAIFPYSGRNLAFRCGDVFSDTPFEGGPAGRHHFMFMARGTGLKVYIDRDRVANLPDVTGQGVATEIDFRLWSANKPMITNVRFAEGCRPPKDMLAEGKLVTYGIHFATGSDVVLPDSAPVLRQIAAYLESNAGVKLRITGHTDNVGSAASNLDLSNRRAASVARVLGEEFGIAAERMATDGRGDTEPVASNDKPEGRAMNRRVEFAKL